MAEHSLKTIDIYFDAVERGEKTFEVRKNDRAFQTGDTLVLMRYENTPIGVRPTVPFRNISKRITYLLQGGQFGLEPGYCVLGLGEPKNG
jgi:ASC-1-like (ASCH) protein